MKPPEEAPASSARDAHADRRRTARAQPPASRRRAIRNAARAAVTWTDSPASTIRPGTRAGLPPTSTRPGRDRIGGVVGARDQAAAHQLGVETPPDCHRRRIRGNPVRSGQQPVGARARRGRQRRTEDGGDGIASPPGGATAAVTPDRTSANGQPSASAIAPSVDGRSPTITPEVPRRSCTRATVGCSGFPATSGVADDAVAIAATIDPAPGINPSLLGYVASRFVATKRAPSRTARGRALELVVVEVTMEADHHGFGRWLPDHGEPGFGERLDHARPGAGEHTRTARERPSRAARPRQRHS